MPHRARQRTSAPAAGRLRLAALAVLLLALPLTWPASTASAAAPVATEPRARQQLSDPPGAVTLAFARDVDPGSAKMIVTGPGGGNVTTGALIVEGTNLTTQLREGLPRGTYTVHYRVARPDGQPEGGAFQFSYGPGSFRAPPDQRWSGVDHEPKLLSGVDPNGADRPTRSAVPGTPGIEITSQGSDTDPAPPPSRQPASEPPASVPAPVGPTTASPSRPGPEVTETAPSAIGTPTARGGGSSTPFVVGAVLVGAALVGAGLGVWHSRRRRPGPHE